MKDLKESPFFQHKVSTSFRESADAQKAAIQREDDDTMSRVSFRGDNSRAHFEADWNNYESH